MRKNKFVSLFLVTLLVSCSNNMSQKEVLQLFCEKNNITSNIYYIGEDYGMYGKARVIQINNDYGYYILVSEQIEDLIFTYPQMSHNIDVLFEEEFYTLTQAYNEKILNYNQLKSINRKHKKYLKKLNIDQEGVIVDFS